ncbi:hypothetical protein AURDEDRAFT_172290 [Auricularia subglabra TFB-10046 SS5]|nr:hypothetical protein AURDEDRAFT_172290 [Auricularia subglabra TFB-10046 SS5]
MGGFDSDIHHPSQRERLANPAFTAQPCRAPPGAVVHLSSTSSPRVKPLFKPTGEATPTECAALDAGGGVAPDHRAAPATAVVDDAVWLALALVGLLPHGRQLVVRTRKPRLKRARVKADFDNQVKALQMLEDGNLQNAIATEEVLRRDTSSASGAPPKIPPELWENMRAEQEIALEQIKRKHSASLDQGPGSSRPQDNKAKDSLIHVRSEEERAAELHCEKAKIDEEQCKRATSKDDWERNKASMRDAAIHREARKAAAAADGSREETEEDEDGDIEMVNTFPPIKSNAARRPSDPPFASTAAFRRQPPARSATMPDATAATPVQPASRSQHPPSLQGSVPVDIPGARSRPPIVRGDSYSMDSGRNASKLSKPTEPTPPMQHERHDLSSPRTQPQALASDPKDAFAEAAAHHQHEQREHKREAQAQAQVDAERAQQRRESEEEHECLHRESEEREHERQKQRAERTRREEQEPVQREAKECAQQQQREQQRREAEGLERQRREAEERQKRAEQEQRAKCTHCEEQERVQREAERCAADKRRAAKDRACKHREAAADCEREHLKCKAQQLQPEEESARHEEEFVCRGNEVHCWYQDCKRQEDEEKEHHHYLCMSGSILGDSRLNFLPSRRQHNKAKFSERLSGLPSGPEQLPVAGVTNVRAWPAIPLPEDEQRYPAEELTDPSPRLASFQTWPGAPEAPAGFTYPRAPTFTRCEATDEGCEYLTGVYETFEFDASTVKEQRARVLRSATQPELVPPPGPDGYPTQYSVPGQRQMTPGVPVVAVDRDNPHKRRMYATLHLPSTVSAVTKVKSLCPNFTELVKDLIRVVFGDPDAEGDAAKPMHTLGYERNMRNTDPRSMKDGEGAFSMAATSGEGQGIGHVQPAKQTETPAARLRQMALTVSLAKIVWILLMVSIGHPEFIVLEFIGNMNNVPGFGGIENKFHPSLQVNVSLITKDVRDLLCSLGHHQGCNHVDPNDYIAAWTVFCLLCRLPASSDPGATCFSEVGLYAHSTEIIKLKEEDGMDYHVCFLTFSGRSIHGSMGARMFVDALRRICSEGERYGLVAYPMEPALMRTGTYQSAPTTGFGPSMSQPTRYQRDFLQDGLPHFGTHENMAAFHAREQAFASHNQRVMAQSQGIFAIGRYRSISEHIQEDTWVDDDDEERL